ncbi:LicD family protein [Alteromonas oceanisediminis]|uniref:LicD family protein n=1 Tax=Alteromonas oceanisediminis TaxID=2836180 RepID=UPI001BDAC9D6|nr:LicD family protein [Alteromonas oceanisediminis]MBT0585039.1 LicD family protein [Alteromonas oceanisediminis]
MPGKLSSSCAFLGDAGALSVLNIGQSASPNSGVVHRVSAKRGQVFIEGACCVLLSRKAIVTATIGDEVCGIEVLNRNDNPFMDTTEVVAFSISIDPILLRRAPSSLLSICLLNDTTSQFYVVRCGQLIDSAQENKQFTVPTLDDIFPSMGFFGGGNHRPLEITIDSKVKAIRLVIEKSNAFLNFAGLELLGKHGERINGGDNVKITASSKLNHKKNLQTVLEGQGFHSAHEDNPWLEIKFDKRCYISKLRITNRKDRWSIRAKCLVVYARFRRNKAALVYSRDKHYFGAERLKIELSQLLTLSDIKQYNGNGVLIRQSMMNKIIEICYRDVSAHEMFELPFLQQLLVTWAEIEFDDLDMDNELALLALVVFKDTLKSIQYDLNIHSRLLSTTLNICKFERYLNKLRTANGQKPVQLTKHGIALKGVLLETSEKVVHVLKNVMEELQRLDYKPCLAYGTLLGAIREKQFIEHDDDVDILIELTDQEISFEQAVELRDRMVEQIDSEKYRIGYGIASNLNVHLYDIQSNVMIDIFPYWYQNGRVMLYMENMSIRSVDSAILSQRSSINFYGVDFPIPKLPERFLAERYGDAWTVSDKFHEWPWKISVNNTY